MSKSLQDLQSVMSSHRPSTKWYRYFVNRSAVALIVRKTERLEVLMIKRADREGDPWSGHMAFPGGRMDKTDRHGLAVATRETWEEIGLADHHYSDCLGRLSDITSRPHKGIKPMVISPYVFSIDCVPTLKLNHEVADVLWVPLDFLADTANRESMEWTMKKMTLTLPCYFYEQQRIWGLSLLMLDELIKLTHPSAP